MTFRPALLLGDRAPYAAGREATVQRVKAVLETLWGTIPWRPEFGCSLEGLLGLPATAANVNDVDWRVRGALARWLPDVEVVRSEVRLLPLAEDGDAVVSEEEEDAAAESLASLLDPSAGGAEIGAAPRDGTSRHLETALLALGTQVRVQATVYVRVKGTSNEILRIDAPVGG
ncbi:MAG: hypothetical protein Q8P41_09980 [Pseudomonadota bacterium]|nr:hypothetical protein [Pseudomonadota bacterium]